MGGISLSCGAVVFSLDIFVSLAVCHSFIFLFPLTSRALIASSLLLRLCYLSVTVLLFFLSFSLFLSLFVISYSVSLLSSILSLSSHAFRLGAHVLSARVSRSLFSSVGSGSGFVFPYQAAYASVLIVFIMVCYGLAVRLLLLCFSLSLSSHLSSTTTAVLVRWGFHLTVGAHSQR